MADFTALPNAGGSIAALPSMRSHANGRSFVIGGAACFAAAITLLGAQLYAFDAVVAAAAVFLSADGIVEPGNRRALSAALLSAAALAASAGALLLALSVPAWRAVMNVVVTWDPLRRLGLDVPNAHLLLASSVTVGALLIGMHLVGSRLGGPLAVIFRKEGPLELLTVVLLLAAAVGCVAAARHWNKYRKRLLAGVPVLYATLAIGLFWVAMEELNWGQTLLGFETPPAWAEINYQQQTSIHNLLSGQMIEIVERALAVLFGIGVLALMGLALKFPRSAFAAIAPPAALGALAMLCAVPGAYLRLEVTELLLAVFFAFYSYRIYVAARSHPAPRA